MSMRTSNRVKRADSSNAIHNLSLHDFAETKSTDVMSSLNDAPPPLHHAASDPMSCGVTSSYEVRPCRVEDTDSIDTIMRKAWPDEPEWRNPQYWTKQFIKPTSQRYGYVIEEVGTTDNDDSKDNINNDHNSKVIGFAMYKWSQPSNQTPLFNRYGYGWYINDFNTKTFGWKNGFNQKTSTVGGYNNLYYNNKNLKENWNKLSTHIVHITDVAIHPHQRGKGLGTQLMQSMIYSFPSGTRFGLEVKCSNYGGVKCYQKCGFEIKRTMQHYYGRDKSGYKMVLISNYDDENVTNFIRTTQLKRSEKERQNVRKELENFHINNVKSKVNKENKEKYIEKKEIDENKDNDYNVTVKIERGLKRLCGDDWSFYFQNFKNQEVYDDDLIDLKEDDLEKLIPKLGPRSRVRRWINALKSNK